MEKCPFHAIPSTEASGTLEGGGCQDYRETPRVACIFYEHFSRKVPPLPNKKFWTVPNSWIICKLVIPSRFISWKTHFLMFAGSGSYQIWLGWLTAPRSTALIVFGKNALPANIRKWVFHEIKCDGITSLHGIHVIESSSIQHRY